MAGVLGVLAALLLTAVAAAACTVLLRPAGRLDAAVVFGVLAATGVTVAVELTGAVGLLNPAALLGALTLWAAAALALARDRLHRPRPGTWWRRLPADARRHPVAAAAALVAALALGWETFVGLLLPTYAYDGITYHLTTVASWVQAHDLHPQALSVCCAYYPAGPEVLVAAPAVLLGGDGLVGVGQVPFVLLGALATAGLARSAGTTRAGAAAAGALFTLCPVVLTQASTNYVDVTQAALVLAALHALVRFATTGRTGAAVVAALAAGLVLGSKGTGPLWALVLLVLLLAVAVRRHRLRPVLPAAAAAVLLGGWWYLRNLVDTGNPLYPFAVRLFGRTVLDGPFDPDAVLTRPPVGAGDPWPLTMLRNWAGDLDFWHQGSYEYEQRLGGLGPLWPWLGLPALLVVAVLLARRREPVVLAFAATAVVLLLQPYAWWSRFTLPLAALGAVAVCLVCTRAPWRPVRWAVAAAAAVLTLAGAVLSVRTVERAGGGTALRAVEVLRLVGRPASERTVGRLFHPEYAFLDQVPPDASVVVDLGAPEVRFVAPLFGADFTRHVRAGSGSAPTGAWILTARGRPLDLAAAGAHVLVQDRRGVRVWRPVGRR